MNKKIVRAVVLLAMTFGQAGAFAEEAGWTAERLNDELGVQPGWTVTKDLPTWSAEPVILVSQGRDFTANLGAAIPGAEIIEFATVAEAMPHAARANAILGSCNAELLAAAPNLAWVFVFHAGVDRCDFPEQLADRDVVVTNFQKLASPTIAEHAIAMMLALRRGLVFFGKEMEAGAWRRDLATRSSMHFTSGRTVLVAGLGGIGQQIARRVDALGMEVLATRNSSREGPAYVDYVGLADELPELVKRADVVINSLPLTDSTQGLFDATLFANFKDGAYFINVGRGGTVDTDALLDALTSNRLAGAGLDVTDPEPLPPEHPLWQQANVIITPHVSARGFDRGSVLAGA